VKPKELAEIRKRWGLTQAQMADLMEVSGKLIVSHWENGFRSPSSIVQKLYRMIDELPDHEAKQLVKWLEKYSSKESDK
jgi:DNA-binding transcriptional regulator YiaG